MSNTKKTAIGVLVALVVVGGGFAAYQHFAKEPVAAPVQQPDKQDAPTKPNDQPTPAPVPAKPADKAPEPTAPPATSTPSGDVISFNGYQGSGSLPVSDRNLANNAFQIERIDWSESNKSVTIIGKMRAFEGVGYMRVQGENRELLEPERVVKAPEGAPSWSSIKADFALAPDYKGKTLRVEFYTKSAKDGSKSDVLTVKIKPQ